jgi:cyclopropane fatty-acyl-phospholipid synthase-like methyltransferase
MQSDDLGLGARDGGQHYRAYVGPPGRYDIVAAMAFNLLTTIGLRQGHRVLDIGCGSLRIGRLLIPYLNSTNYVGVEPQKWLVEEGIKKEVGNDQVKIKRPRFFFGDSPACLPADLYCDYAVAQAVFPHLPLERVRLWLEGASQHLNPDGALIATFLAGSADHSGELPPYPQPVTYTRQTMNKLAEQTGYIFQELDWRHPHDQTWALFAKPQYNAAWFRNKPLTWNTKIEAFQI